VVTTNATTDELEGRIADLKAQHAATLESVAVAVAELGPLDEALEQARAVYEEAGRAMMTTQRAYAGPTHDPYATHRAKSPAEQDQARRDAQEAEATFRAADEALGQALVRRNTVDARRSDLLMHSYRLEAAIGEAERELERAQRAADPDVDLLAKIKERLLGGVA
jgi:chromosome segregation ATPase